ncbi:diguanylate phosphodiesterase [Pseudomonas sp. FW305-E2]|nr:diguanylate phosphodiesterase [Pseudomonas sp. FW305-E2]
MSASGKSSARAAHRALPNPRCVCRSGFTREYGGGGNGDRRVEIGQQGRPFRG